MASRHSCLGWSSGWALPRKLYSNNLSTSTVSQVTCSCFRELGMHRHSQLLHLGHEDHGVTVLLLGRGLAS